ncbi:MAG: ribosome recycling factor [Planctomycetota bacterium]
MLYQDILNDTKAKMKKAVDHFVDETKGLRSGRATPALVENIRVDYYGTQMPLNQLATISVPDPRSLAIKPFDQGALKEIEKAIQKSAIGINPQSDGKLIRLIVPMMSEDQRKKLVGRLKEIAEATRVSVRNIRRDENKHIDTSKSGGSLTEDEVTRLKDEIDKLTKKTEQDVDQVFANKSKEIMEA